MPEQRTHRTNDHAGSSKKRIHVRAAVLVGRPAMILSATERLPAESTVEAPETAQGKAARPLRGRFAHVPYSSEDLIREKGEEAELEDRST